MSVFSIFFPWKFQIWAVNNFFQGRGPVWLLLQLKILTHIHRLEYWWTSHPQTPHLGQVSERDAKGKNSRMNANVLPSCFLLDANTWLAFKNLTLYPGTNKAVGILGVWGKTFSLWCQKCFKMLKVVKLRIIEFFSFSFCAFSKVYSWACVSYLLHNKLPQT